jgi:hypothetical protein
MIDDVAEEMRTIERPLLPAGVAMIGERALPGSDQYRDVWRGFTACRFAGPFGGFSRRSYPRGQLKRLSLNLLMRSFRRD